MNSSEKKRIIECYRVGDSVTINNDYLGECLVTIKELRSIVCVILFESENVKIFEKTMNKLETVHLFEDLEPLFKIRMLDL
jgi:hypothetical protein